MKQQLKAALALALALVIVSTSMTVPAQAVADGNYPCSGGGTFTVGNGGTQVTQSSGDCSGVVTIPASVTSFASMAFMFKAAITGVVFEEGSAVTNLQTELFRSTGLTSIVLPPNLTSIGNQVFQFTKLVSITLPGKVTSTGDQAFPSSLETIVVQPRIASTFQVRTLPDDSKIQSITFQGPGTINSLPSVTRTGFNFGGWSASLGGPAVTFPHTFTAADGGALYPIMTAKVIDRINCSGGGGFEVIDGVVQPFNSCSGEITIPSNVTSISANAFYNQVITKINFPADSQVTSIGVEAFRGSQITSIDFPSSLKVIDRAAFKNSSIRHMTIPGRVEFVGEEFAPLETLVFETRIAAFLTVHQYAFSGARGLTSVTFNTPYTLTVNVTMEKPVFNFLGWSDSLDGPIRANPGTVSGTVYTRWSPKTYTATYDSNGGTPVASGSIVGGVIAFPEPPTRQGYTFAGWYNNAAGSGNAITNWMFDNNPTFYAKWIINRKVSFDSKGGSPVSDGEWIQGGSITTAPTAPTRLGYTFAGWSSTDGGPAITFPHTPGGTVDITLFARWTLNTYLANLVTLGGSAVSARSFVSFGSLPTPPDSTRPGYTFAGWSATEGGDVVTFPYSPGVLDNISLYAKWIANTYLVNLNASGGSPVSPGSFQTDGEISSSLNEPYRPGYRFAGWSATQGGEILVFPYSPGVIGNITLYAIWDANTHAVNLNANGGSSVPPVSFRTDGSISSAPPTPIRAGYTLLGWSTTDGGDVVSFPYEPGVMENIILYAKWDANTYSVTLDSKGGLAVPAVSFRTDGVIALAPAAAIRVGYTFQGWSATEGGTAVAFPYAPGVSENITLYANWTLNNYSVTYNANGGVAVPNGSFTVEHDLLLVTPIRAGYTFNGWSATDGGSLISFPYTPSVLENITLYANWTRNPYKPELLANATVSGTGFQSTNMKATFGSWSAYPDAVLSVQWYRCGKAVAADLSSLAASANCVVISGATKTTYKVVLADELKYLTVLVQAKNTIGTTFTTSKSFRAPELKAPSKVELPDVSGEGVAKQSLSVDIGTWKANPIAKTSIQWFRCEDDTKVSSSTVPKRSECVAIKGATSTRYRLVTADEGKYITAQIEAENSEGTAFTTATSVRVALTPSVIANPDIFGTAQIGKVVTASSGRWLAFPAADTSVQWFRCNKETLAGAKKFGSSSGCVAIKGATKSRYTVTAADRGKHISALVTAENKAGDETVTTDSQQVSYEPTNTTDPIISGTATVGRTLEATSGGWTGFPEETISFAWYRCSNPTVAGSESFARASGCVPIGGANDSSYTLAGADGGKHISVLVKATNSAGSNTVTARSTAEVTQEPTKTANPSISGSATVGRTLNATPGGWTAFPQERTSFTWYRCENPASAGSDSFDSSSGCVAIGGATQSRYTVKEADQGKYIAVLVRASNSAGSSSATSKSTTRVG